MRRRRMNHFKLGEFGEDTAYYALKRAGYAVERLANGHHNGDLLASKGGRRWRVEVKTARRGIDGKWRFLLKKKDRWGVTDHRGTHYVLLIALQRRRQPVLFLVPTADIRSQRTASITSNPTTYSGRYARYRVDGALRLA